MVAVTLLLVYYVVVTFQRAALLLMDTNPLANAPGAAYLVLPAIGAWALFRELRSVPTQNRWRGLLRPRGSARRQSAAHSRRTHRPCRSGPGIRKVSGETEDAPGDWRSWFRLSCVYDAAGDRKRVRSSMRDAERLYRFADTGATV